MMHGLQNIKQIVYVVKPLYCNGVYVHVVGTAGNISPIVIKAWKSIKNLSNSFQPYMSFPINTRYNMC
jgi:hypothetical protein